MSASMMILLKNLLGYVAEDVSALADTSRTSRIQPDSGWHSIKSPLAKWEQSWRSARREPVLVENHGVRVPAKSN
jgi:hypothetical protein